MGIEKNTVPATNQVSKNDLVRIVSRGGSIRILFLGNSITRHAPKPEIGWEHDFGMAASCEENDYVHRIISALDAKGVTADYATVSCGGWERGYFDEERTTELSLARDFAADIVIFRTGENTMNIKDKIPEIPLAPYIVKFVDYFCVKPGCHLLMTDMFWPHELIDQPIREAAAIRACPLVHLGDLGHIPENEAHDRGFWHTGVAMHPGDLGMQRIAERILAAIPDEWLA